LIDVCLPDAVGGLLALPLADTLKQSHPQSPHAARCCASSLAGGAPGDRGNPGHGSLGTACSAAIGGVRVASTIERADKWLAQTPQMFRIGLLRDALAAHAGGGFVGITDEASAVEAAGYQPLLVRGSAHNLKVTYPEDFALAEAVLRSRGA
jgi:2-C-methyl-D-erythritol 4-phosphate cytidylyltransferase